jgi:hypothetical protein
MKPRFTYSIDHCDTEEHVAQIDNLTVAVATYKADCERWLGDSTTGFPRDRGQPMTRLT